MLRIHVHAGEAVSETFPAAVMDLADLSRLRVRAEIDERDVARIAIGARADIRVDRGDGSLTSAGSGSVTWLSPDMGRKKVINTDPSSRRDTDVRETLIDLDVGPQSHLPLGLRVTAVLFAP
ncbi:MAG: secretion protein HlyD family protein [Hydrocarboniphaga sp.]|nr:secretion protein HlyD family protein [Hydrocarboniphaga sp.]